MAHVLYCPAMKHNHRCIFILHVCLTVGCGGGGTGGGILCGRATRSIAISLSLRDHYSNYLI